MKEEVKTEVEKEVENEVQGGCGGVGGWGGRGKEGEEHLVEEGEKEEVGGGSGRRKWAEGRGG